MFPVKLTGLLFSPSQYSKSPGLSTTGNGWMVTDSLAVMFPLHVPLAIYKIGVSV